MAKELAEQTKSNLQAGDITSTVRHMVQLVDLLDVQLRNLTPGGKDSAARSLNKVRPSRAAVGGRAFAKEGSRKSALERTFLKERSRKCVLDRAFFDRAFSKECSQKSILKRAFSQECSHKSILKRAFSKEHSQKSVLTRVFSQERSQKSVLKRWCSSEITDPKCFVFLDVLHVLAIWR